MSPRKQYQAGLTLIELCICLGLAAVLCAQAVPAMARIKVRNLVQSTAQTIRTDILQARSEAVRRGSAIQVQFSQHPRGLCYIVHTGAKGQCLCDDNGQSSCPSPGAKLLKTQWIATNSNMNVTTNIKSMNIEGRQGTVTPTGSVELTGRNGETIRHKIAITGRIQSCSPNRSFSKLPKCA